MTHERREIEIADFPPKFKTTKKHVPCTKMKDIPAPHHPTDPSHTPRLAQGPPRGDIRTILHCLRRSKLRSGWGLFELALRNSDIMSQFGYRTQTLSAKSPIWQTQSRPRRLSPCHPTQEQSSGKPEAEVHAATCGAPV